MTVRGSRDRDDVRCPSCRGVFPSTPSWPTRCNLCRSTVAVLEFSPPPNLVEEAKAAMPEDVACAFHPNKRADTVCDGTGSYICALCAVPVGGKTYSTEFINTGGLDRLGKGDVFERTLPRPDAGALWCFVLGLLCFCTLVGPVVLMGYIAWYMVQHRKLRNSSELYARVTGRNSGVLMVVGLVVL
ncbi:unnamed protein product, partial [Ectocarpus fasciculatus]